MPDQVHLFTNNMEPRIFTALNFLGRTQQRYIDIYPGKSILRKFKTEGVRYEKQKIRLPL